MMEEKIFSVKHQEFTYVAFIQMEDLLDKLKLLKYESEFLRDLKIKPIHRYYFTVEKNPGEQFYLFSLLAAWLIRKSGINFEQPQEFDDPNDTVLKIIDAAREYGIIIDFAPNKLKQGVGEHVVYVLNNLADQAIKKNNIILQKPKTPYENCEETEIMYDESEINLDRVEEEMMAAYSDDSDEENIFHLDDVRPTKLRLQPVIFKSEINEDSWKLEVERVLPQLKITIKNDSSDWRSHLEQMTFHKNNIDECLGTSKTQLEKLYKDITIVLEKITNREKYFNRELDSILETYRNLLDQLSKVKDNYKDISSGVAERNRELYKLNGKLESLKQQMEERGSSMTDGTPLVNIKKSAAKIKAEIIDMDVRIGVLECILLQAHIRDEKLIENEFGQQISVF